MKRLIVWIGLLLGQTNDSVVTGARWLTTEKDSGSWRQRGDRRRSFATWLLAAGHNLQFVKDAGRLKSTRIVSELFGHLERSRVDDGMRELGKNWQGAARRANKK